MGPYPVSAPGSAETVLPGGVDAVVYSLARGLARVPGVEVTVITAVPGSDHAAERPGQGFRVLQAPRPRGGRLTGQRQVTANLHAALGELRPDIVHAHGAGIYGLAALDAGAPHVITLHGIIFREARQAWSTSSWAGRLRWQADARMERGVVERARAIIAISPYVLREFPPRPGQQTSLIDNPVDDRFFDLSGRPPGADRLLCVARVIPRKGILSLIEAFARVAQERPAASLRIAGDVETDPGYVRACMERAAALGVADRMVLLGGRAPGEIKDELAGADVLLLASEQETAPVSIAEAMATGRPVVATDVGGCAGMVRDGVTGRIVPPCDPVALAAATLGLLADPAACLRMGEAGRAEAERRFRLGAVVDATLAAYDRARFGAKV